MAPAPAPISAPSGDFNFNGRLDFTETWTYTYDNSTTVWKGYTGSETSYTVPPGVLEPESYYRYKDRCIFCDIIRQELQQDIRVVCANDHFITISPFAPRTPFEMWVLPKNHASGYCAHTQSQ